VLHTETQPAEQGMTNRLLQETWSWNLEPLALGIMSLRAAINRNPKVREVRFKESLGGKHFIFTQHGSRAFDSLFISICLAI
jgi:hypothetical protein